MRLFSLNIECLKMVFLCQVSEFGFNLKGINETRLSHKNTRAVSYKNVAKALH